MLSFFYKYQKGFVGLVLIVLVASGLGFGKSKQNARKTNSSIQIDNIVLDPGVKVSSNYLRALKAFIANEAHPFSGDHRCWNFLNEGLITEHFLTSRIGEKIFMLSYKEGNFPHRDKESSFKLYSRFDAPFISTEEVWKASAPGLMKAFTTFHNVEKPISPEGFASRVNLFLEEKKFPHYLLLQMLEYRRKTYDVKIDPAFTRKSNLKLFGYNNLIDWFGDAYIDNIIATILNVISSNQGYKKISRSEAMKEIKAKAKLTVNRLRHIDKDINVDQFLNNYFQFLNVSERDVVEVYRDLILFKAIMLQHKGSIPYNFDPLSKFFSMGNDSVEVELFFFPKEFQIKNKWDLQAFETYLQLVGIPTKSILDVPKYYLPVKAIKEKAPELVGRRFILSYRHVHIDQLVSHIPVVKVKQWLQNDSNFSEVRHVFRNELKSINHSKELSNCDVKLQSKIDMYVRKKLVNENHQIIQQVLDSLPEQAYEVVLCKGKTHGLIGIDDGEALAKKLMLDGCLTNYTQNGEHFYHFVMNKCFPNEEVLVYREALSRGIMEAIVEKHLDPQHIDNVIQALVRLYCEEDYKIAIKKRLQHVMQQYIDTSGESSRGNTLAILPDKVIKVYYRKDLNLPDSFERMVSYEGNFSEVFVHEDALYCYRCLAFIPNTSPVIVDKMLYIKHRLDEEILESHLDQMIPKHIL